MTRYFLAAGAALLALVVLTTNASAHERRSHNRIVQRCDHDGDVCAAFRCDWDGDDCVQIGPWHQVYVYRSPYEGYSRYPGAAYGWSFGDQQSEEWRERHRGNDEYRDDRGERHDEDEDEE